VKLTAAELAYVRSRGLYVCEKCDACGKVLNHSFRYTIAGKPGVYCLALCRDRVFFDDSHEAKRWANPRKCASCAATLERKRRQATFWIFVLRGV